MLTEQKRASKPDLSKLRILVCAPLHDLATQMGYEMAQRLIRLLKNNPHIYYRQLMGVFFNNFMLRKLLKEEQFDVLIYYGHGKQIGWFDGLFAVRNEMPFNESLGSLMKGMIVYTMACDSAKGFGEQLVAEGVRAYIGNTETIWGEWNMSYNDNMDDFALIWNNEIANLLGGVSVRECVINTKKAWEKFAIEMESRPDLNELMRMTANKAHTNGRVHVYVGDGGAIVRVPVLIEDLNRKP